MNEIVKEWVVNNIQEQLDDLDATLENEKLWLLGSKTLDAITGHTENIKLLCEAMAYYDTQLREIMGK